MKMFATIISTVLGTNSLLDIFLFCRRVKQESSVQEISGLVTKSLTLLKFHGSPTLIFYIS